jgi:hypothetical protein
MAKEKRKFRELCIEVLIPTIIFTWIAPVFMNQVWLNVKADPSTPWYTYAELHALTIAIGVCWVGFYNSIRLGLFPKNQRR